MSQKISPIRISEQMINGVKPCLVCLKHVQRDNRLTCSIECQRKLWGQNNLQRILEYGRRYQRKWVKRKGNREKNRKSSMEWRKRNLEYCREKAKIYGQACRDLIKKHKEEFKEIMEKFKK